MAWIGDSADLVAGLQAAGAECDETGAPRVWGLDVFSFMRAGREVLIADTVKVRIDGAYRSAAEVLSERGVGCGGIVVL